MRISGPSEYFLGRGEEGNVPDADWPTAPRAAALASLVRRVLLGMLIVHLSGISISDEDLIQCLSAYVKQNYVLAVCYSSEPQRDSRASRPLRSLA